MNARARPKPSMAKYPIQSTFGAGRQRGVSLLELLVTLGILSILAAIATPAMSGMLADHRLASSRHLLHTQLSIARNTAITQAMPVRVCPSSDGLKCNLDGNWNARWLMYRDRHALQHPGQPEDILTVSDPPRLPDGAAITSTSGRHYVRFQSDGRSGGSNLTLSFCMNGTLRSEIRLNNVGRARVVTKAAAKPCP